MMAPACLPLAIPTGRYVVLQHLWPAVQTAALAGQVGTSQRGDHYDWMFEVQGRLLTWASEQFFPPVQSAAISASRLASHRLTYLRYEGAVSGGRGTVQRIESGYHRLVHETTNRYEFAVWGGRCGIVTIYRTRRDSASEAWVIEFEPNRDERPTRADAS